MFKSLIKKHSLTLFTGIVRKNLENIYNSNKVYTFQQRGFKNTTILNSVTKTYTNSEEWLYETYEATRMGLTTNAISELSDLVYIEFLHEKGDIINKDDEIVMIESVKATNSISAPYDLILLANNEDIEENLDVINSDPENVDTSWIIKIDKLS